MFDTLTRLFVQGGQVANPDKHIFGLANSPKVKNMCMANCADGDNAVWKTILVQGDGYGGRDVFALDITNPVSEMGFTEPPVMPLWHGQNPDLRGDYDLSVGQTISVPGFFLHKSPTMNDQRLIMGSGYPDDGAPATQGRRLVIAQAQTGQVLETHTVSSGRSCPQEYTVLADVATAKNFEKNQDGRLRAAYFGDTWGQLWRYDGKGVAVVEDFGCEAPLHFSPTVIQLDRDDSSNRSGESYLVQVTNSALDNDTYAFKASEMVIMKETKDQDGDATLDVNFGSSGKLKLTVGEKEMCAVTSPGGGCTRLMPTHARPAGTPLAILKKDGSGFQSMSMWYAEDRQGCSKGTSWFLIHEVVGSSVALKQAVEVAQEPVTSPVVVGGRIFVVGSQGSVEITADIESSLSTGTASPVDNAGVGIYEILGWSEVP
jgi:hypothetical protein